MKAQTLAERSLDAERDFLACAAADPAVVRFSGLTEEHFGSVETQRVFRCLTELVEAGKTICTDTVLDWGIDSKIGRFDPLWLWTVPPMPAEVHAERVKHFARVQSAKHGVEQALIAAVDGDLDGLDKALGRLAEARSADLRGIPGGQAGEVSTKAMVGLAQRAASPIKIRCFIDRVDQAVGFLGAGDLILIGADTNVGKTSTALGCLIRAAEAGIPCGLISHEDGEGTIGLKLVSRYSGIRAYSLRTMVGLDASGAATIRGAVDKIRALPMHMRFPIGGTELDTVACMRSLAGLNVRLVVVDYAQTINASFKAQTRRDEVRRVASAIKRAAHELGMCVVLTSQLSRPPKPMRPGEAASFRIPTLHDFKEAGDLENMCEVALGIWRYAPDAQDAYGRVLKSKWGGIGTHFRLLQTDAGILDDDRGFDGRLPEQASQANGRGPSFFVASARGGM